MNARILLLYLTLAVMSLTHCDADRSMRLLKGPKNRRNVITKSPKKLKMVKHLDLDPTIFSSNAQAYSVSSPFSLPPYESLAPITLPENSPPYCVFPPPGTPTTIPTPSSSQPNIPSPPYYYSSPSIPAQNPPPSPTTIIPGPPVGSLPTPSPEIVPSPPGNTPGSPEPILNPPVVFPGPPGTSMSPPYIEPSPPSFEPTPFIPSPTGGTTPSPPSSFPSPTGGSVPSPTVFQPPVVYPPPSVPPPPNMAPRATLWCVAKPSVPDPIIQEAMNYACWSGADCTSIQPNGPCYEPNNVWSHASYAFNSYWQRTKGNGGTCEFGGTAMLVAVDPSSSRCHFTYY